MLRTWYQSGPTWSKSPLRLNKTLTYYLTSLHLFTVNNTNFHTSHLIKISTKHFVTAILDSSTTDCSIGKSRLHSARSIGHSSIPLFHADDNNTSKEKIRCEEPFVFNRGLITVVTLLSSLGGSQFKYDLKCLHLLKCNYQQKVFKCSELCSFCHRLAELLIIIMPYGCSSLSSGKHRKSVIIHAGISNNTCHLLRIRISPA
jgi:hypothetical protein